MARRKPVVATAVGGIPEVVADGVSTACSSRRRILRRWPRPDPAGLITLSPQRLGDAGYEIVAERFSIDARSAGSRSSTTRSCSAPAPYPPSAARAASSVIAQPAGRAALEIPPL